MQILRPPRDLAMLILSILFGSRLSLKPADEKERRNERGVQIHHEAWNSHWAWHVVSP